MKTNNLSLVAVGILLITAVMVSYLISKPVVVPQKEMPVFWGESVVVHKAIKANTAIRAVGQQGIKAKEATGQGGQLIPLPIMPPKISYSVLPQYPQSALRQGLAGTTVLSIFVGAQGRAERVEVKASSGVVELDQSAAAAVEQWTFAPATQGGLALASWLEIPVRFEVN